MTTVIYLGWLIDLNCVFLLNPVIHLPGHVARGLGQLQTPIKTKVLHIAVYRFLPTYLNSELTCKLRGIKITHLSRNSTWLDLATSLLVVLAT